MFNPSCQVTALVDTSKFIYHKITKVHSIIILSLDAITILSVE